MRLSFPIFTLTLAALALATAPVSEAGCGGCEGHKHEMDIVDTAVHAGSFQTLVKAVKAADLVETLKGEGPFTVFAPTDAAFGNVPSDVLTGLLADKAALADVLTYHVVPGRVPASKVLSMNWAETAQGQSLRIEQRDGSVYVDGARVVKTDIETSNGLIHVIDSVMLPRKDIVDTAVAAGSFQTLVTAVKAADLVETLKGKGPFTVFAPADAAFAKVPEATLSGLLENKKALAGVLTYHVVPGRILSSDLRPDTMQEIATANGQSLTIKVDRSGNVFVNGAQVTSADILAGNGVIHVIDAVVLPQQS